MSTEDNNKAVVKRWNEEGFNQHNIGLIDECFHQNYSQRSGTVAPWSVTIQGRKAAKINFEQGFREFPTARVTIEDMIAEGDKVAMRVTLYIEEKAVSYGAIMYRLVAGQILDDWFCWTNIGTPMGPESH